jgi:hypothetical protein
MLLAVGTSTYFTPTRIDSAIDDAYLQVASAKPWPPIKKGFVTGTIMNQQYYDYPDNCQTESVFRISVGGESHYQKIDFEDFLKFTEEEPDSLDKKWSEFGRQIFITPTPTVTGSTNLVLWGVIQAAPLLNGGDVTMFTDYSDVLNEAIMQYAYANLVQNFDTLSKQNRSLEAIARADRIIAQEFKKIADRQQRKLLERPQFDVPDYFNNASSNIGQFEIDK